MNQNQEFLSWDQVHNNAIELVDKIESSNIKYEGIVAITKGGLIPTAIVARYLGIDLIDTFCINSYKNKKQTEIEILKYNNIFRHERIIFIDDLTDTGKTIKTIKENIYFMLNADFACLYTKPLGEKEVKYSVKSYPQDTWIVFPWEFRK